MIDTHVTLAESVVPITQDLFTAMIDGEPGLLTPADAITVPMVDPVHAWVDIVGPAHYRALVVTPRATADRLARALLQMTPDEDVSLEDVEDALGEVANVVGGNLKGMLPEGSSLTLPVVDVTGPTASRPADHEQPLLWRGDPLVISLWTPKNGEEL
ncbi:chemotaxis protein CheX [Cellulosimicrobium sp. NPDC057127]|uniref:chemotaxis protein CheX n=1 Tax=Cellulosimicrobium sp. NPDC057127 TaxID=3346026 RepID=UPI0036408670